jgi:osmotically-inducible protein OsmY
MKPLLIAATMCTSLALGFAPTPYTPEAPPAAQAPPAQEQSNKKEDVELTRKIREELMKQETLSVAAKNVKVVTKDGITHLSGSVKTPEEKDLIESIAKRHAGEANVQSHIQVQA